MSDAPRRISSRDNPLYRELAELARSAKERRRLGRSVLEGVHLCEAWAERRGAPRLAVASESGARHPEVGPLLAAAGASPVLLADELFESISTLQHGVGVAFVVDTPRPTLPARIGTDAVYLDRIQDPGNVGTLLRSCAAAGVDTVITAPGTAWCWSPKVLRAGMGAHFHLTIVEAVPWDAVRARLGVDAVGTRPDDAVALWEAPLGEPVLWVLGNEGEGVSEEVAADVRRWVRIPQAPGVESLNVGAAAAVCLFEQRRQREAAARG
ncbi:MAG TPA: RNA methyltransferase [Burkholderiaceae bacterium]|nr:RNA methyltransferase [Burkholderiaceae bacterium]